MGLEVVLLEAFIFDVAGARRGVLDRLSSRALDALGAADGSILGAVGRC